VMICRLSGLAVVILLPIRVPVAREASFRGIPFMELALRYKDTSLVVKALGS
jgi:hypothetical protein